MICVCNYIIIIPEAVGTDMLHLVEAPPGESRGLRSADTDSLQVNHKRCVLPSIVKLYKTRYATSTFFVF